MHSYKGSQPFRLDESGASSFANGTSLDMPFDFQLEDKKVLDIKFHAAAKFYPAEDWFTFKITGPGAVPAEQVPRLHPFIIASLTMEVSCFCAHRFCADAKVEFSVDLFRRYASDSLEWIVFQRGAH